MKIVAQNGNPIPLAVALSHEAKCYQASSILIWLYQRRALFIVSLLFFLVSGFSYANESNLLKASGKVLLQKEYQSEGNAWTIKHLRLPNRYGGYAYASYIASGTENAPTIVLAKPYVGIDWTGEAVDERWAAKVARSGIDATDCFPDEDGPKYVAGESSEICYYLSDTASLGQEAFPYLVNNFNVMFAYGRFYAGGSFENDIGDALAALSFLATQRNINRSRIGIIGSSWGGLQSVYATRYTTRRFPVSVAVANSPLIDIPGIVKFYHEELPGLVSPAVLTHYQRFYDPYLRRIDAADASAYTLDELASNIKRPILIAHDDGDTIIPARFSNALAALSPERVDGFWYEMMDQAPWQTRITSHGELEYGHTIAPLNTFTAAYLFTALGGVEQIMRVPYSYFDMSKFFTHIKQYQIEERDVSWLIPRLLEMASSQLSFVELSQDSTIPEVNGEMFVSYWLNTIWNTNIYTPENVKQLLSNSGLPYPADLNSDYIRRLTGLDTMITNRFSSGFESIDQFLAKENSFLTENFYITPQEHTYLDDEGRPSYTDHTRHELTDLNVLEGRFAHKAWITGQSNIEIPGKNTNHRGYPTVEFHKTILEEGTVNGRVFLEFWVWLDEFGTLQEGDWVSLATLSSYADTTWPQVQLLNIDHQGRLHLMHVPNQGEKVQSILEPDLRVPMRQWVKLSLLIDYTDANSYHSPYISVWQNETLVSIAKFNPRIERSMLVNLKYSGLDQAGCLSGWDEHMDSIADAEQACGLIYKGGLSQLHLGLYAPPHLTSGVVYNDKLSIFELNARYENDTDLDGIADVNDNCVRHANFDQRDTDGDGFGNRCDADVTNNNMVTQEDVDLIRNWINTQTIGDEPLTDKMIAYYNELSDLNGDGVSNAIDIEIAESLRGTLPGPKADQESMAFLSCFAQEPRFDTPDSLPQIAIAPFSEDSLWKRKIPANAIYEEVGEGILVPVAGATNSRAPTNIDLDIVSVCYDDPTQTEALVGIVDNAGYSFPYRATSVNTIGTINNVQYSRHLSHNACSSLSWKPGGNALFAIINPQTGRVDTGGAAWRCAGGPLLNYLKDEPSSHNNIVDNNGSESVPGRASRLSPLGGLVREGELLNGIDHAVAIAMPQVSFYRDGDDRTSTYVWPANDSDNSWHDGQRAYQGSDEHYKMGSLVALKPGVADDLQLETLEGQNLAKAAEEYGMYIVDSSGIADIAKGEQPTMTFAIEDRAALNDLGVVVSPYTGLSIGTVHVDGEAFKRDLLKIIRSLHVISNNGLTNAVFHRFHEMSEALYDGMGSGTWGIGAYGYRMALRDSYWRADVYGRLGKKAFRHANVFSQRQKEVVAYLMNAQAIANTGVFPFPADVNNPEFGREIGYIIDHCAECVRDGWIYTLPGQNIDKLYYDHGYALTTLARFFIDHGQTDSEALRSIRAAADWILDKPVSDNINYNSALIKGLSYAYKATGDERYRARARELHRHGVYPGFIGASGLQAYAADDHNARLEYHGFIVSGMIALISILDSSDEYYEPLMSHLEMTLSHMANENRVENGSFGETWPGTNLLAWYELHEYRDLRQNELAAVTRIVSLIEGYVGNMENETDPFRLQKALYSYFFLGLMDAVRQ